MNILIKEDKKKPVTPAENMLIVIFDVVTFASVANFFFFNTS